MNDAPYTLHSRGRGHFIRPVPSFLLFFLPPFLLLFPSIPLSFPSFSRPLDQIAVSPAACPHSGRSTFPFAPEITFLTQQLSRPIRNKTGVVYQALTEINTLIRNKRGFWEMDMRRGQCFTV